MDEAIFEGVDDSDGCVGDALQRAVGDWGSAWAAVDERDPDAVAHLVLAALEANDYGISDGIIPAFGNALGREGLRRIEEITRSAMKSHPRQHRGRGAWDPRWSRLCIALRDVADTASDPDLFVEALQLSGHDVLDHQAASRPNEAPQILGGPVIPQGQALMDFSSATSRRRSTEKKETRFSFSSV